MGYRIGIDLGGTNISVGLVDENYRVTAERRAKTRAPRPAGEIAAEIAAMIRSITEETGITPASAGIASPGLIEGRTVLCAGNLRFYNVPLADLLEEAAGLPCTLMNDANAAVLGEYTAGAGRGTASLVMITLGTGVGGGILRDGRIVNGIDGRGGEIGHFPLVPDGLPCTCGQRGCFETCSSATALVRQTREAMEKDPASLMWSLAEGDPGKISGRTAFDAARQGDAAAAAVVESYIAHLARGIARVIEMLAPDRIILGGGVANEGENLLIPVRARVREFCPDAETEIVAAALGRHAAVIGALAPCNPEK